MELENQLKARLVLEDGSVYEGLSIGVPGIAFGEIVFNTSTTGYQEILTDPSYRGQVVLLTYPEIGNYGVNLEDFESERIHATGFVVKHLSRVSSSWRSQFTLNDFLIRNGIVGIEGIDTRAVTRKIRDAGAMRCGITTHETELPDFLNQIKAQPGLDEQDLVGQVTTPKAYALTNDTFVNPDLVLNRLVVVDFGIKESILHYLQQYVRDLTVLPAQASFEDIAALHPEGVLLSNGPGDPSVLHGAIAMAKKLIDSGIPTFGICLGHQILALACGAKVSKMPFGHHGGNHPVKDLEIDQITITSQNHGYAVEADHYPKDTMKITHINLNDGSIEGFRHLKAPVCSVQFHPEASPGPHDTQYLFSRFVKEVIQNKTGQTQPA